MAGTRRRGAPVAVGASDLALVYLGIDRRQTAAVPCEPRDGVALVADVIELKDKRVALAAVDARASRQYRVQMREVTGDRRRCIRAARIAGTSASPPRSPRRAPFVAAGAHDFAASDLGIDGLERRAV